MALEQLDSTAAPEDTDSIQAPDIRGPSVMPLDGGETFEYTLASNSFGHYCVPVDLADTKEAASVTAAAVPELSTVELICRKMGKGDLITGSTGFGAFLPAFHEALSANAMIYGFEPTETAFGAASFTTRLNGLENVNLHNVIAGKRARDFPKARLVDRNPEDEKATGPVSFVEMKKLDTIVPQGRYVSVIHLKSYSMEMPALLGAKRIVQDCAPLLVMKAPRTRTQRFFLSCLQAHFPDLKYQFAGVMDENAIFVPLNRA